jgi:drug/metabolite transporter (DMT)-like permease
VRFAGELAALGTAVCWAVGSNLFAGAVRTMGSVVLNRLRITVGMVLLMLALLVLRGSPWPTWASGPAVALLAVSGLIGFVFGDTWYFRCLGILGPGRAALLASLAPVITVVLGWPLLGERPGPMALLGMALTIGGIAWVLWEREQKERSHVEGSAAMGVLAGVLAAVGQAVGYVISKRALATGLDPLSATVVRVVAATVGIWLLAAMQRDVRRTLAHLREGRATAFMASGAVFGPFLGVTLSLTALQFVQAGVAASITAIYPLLTLVISSRAHGERLTLRTLAGAVVAVAGVVVLFLR